MKAWILPSPGTPGGPCKGRCAHPDCREVRALAKATCLGCGERIGYDAPFYDMWSARERKVLGVDADNGLEHQECLDDCKECMA